MSQLPIFKGENYQFWSLKMATLFRSQELWNLVEEGFDDDQSVEPDQQLRERRKKDSKALFMIQQALDDAIFPRIASATTSKQAWDVLKQEYLGDAKVMAVRLQSLRREFETALMKDKEKVQDYLSRISNLVQQMRSYGEEVRNKNIVGKVLRSLTADFNHVVAAIEESKDMETYTFEELMGSLQAHAERLKRPMESKDEKAFQVNSSEKPKRFAGRGGSFRGRGRGRSQFNSGREQGEQGFKRLKCYYCNKPGHREAECWKKKGDLEKDNNHSNMAEDANKSDNSSKLFMAENNRSNDSEEIWYIDSGCSNHMSSTRKMFRDLDKSKTGTVRLGDGKQLEVVGTGTITIQSQQGSPKHLANVQYVPHLAHIC